MQAQRVFSFNGNHARYALGAEAGWAVFVGEVGLAYRTADDLHVSTPLLHLGTIISLVFTNFGVQVDIPVGAGSSTKPAYPVEASVVLSLKVPFLVQ